MVSFKFTSFFFMLMLVLRYSYANSQIPQAAGNDDISGAVAAGKRNSRAVEKFIIGGVITPKEANNGNILGRKMMKRKVSATIFAGEGMQKLNSDSKRRSRIARHRHAARKLKYNSFAALNADYHPPRSHAPKNN